MIDFSNPNVFFSWLLVLIITLIFIYRAYHVGVKDAFSEMRGQFLSKCKKDADFNSGMSQEAFIELAKDKFGYDANVVDYLNFKRV